jgi:hypothetical protein
MIKSLAILTQPNHRQGPSFYRFPTKGLGLINPADKPMVCF